MADECLALGHATRRQGSNRVMSVVQREQDHPRNPSRDTFLLNEMHRVVGREKCHLAIFQLVRVLSVRHLGDQRPLLPRLHADIVTKRCSPCR